MLVVTRNRHSNVANSNNEEGNRLQEKIHIKVCPPEHKVIVSTYEEIHSDHYLSPSKSAQIQNHIIVLIAISRDKSMREKKFKPFREAIVIRRNEVFPESITLS